MLVRLPPCDTVVPAPGRCQGQLSLL